MIKLKRLLLEDQGQRKALPLSKFLPLLKKLEKWSPGIEYSFPADSLAHASQRGPYLKAVAALKKYGKDSNIYIWSVDGPDLGYSEGQKLINGGMRTILKYAKDGMEIGKESPISSVKITMTSPKIDDFGKSMSSGKYGSLD